MQYETLYAPTFGEALTLASERLLVPPEGLECIEGPLDGRVMDEAEAASASSVPTPEPAPTPVEEGMVVFQVRVKPAFWETYVREWIEGFLEVFGIECGIEIETVGTQIFLRLSCSEPSILIGRQGFTLEALQHIVTRVMTSQWSKFPEVIVDVEAYREKKLQRIERMARSAAQRALRSGRPQELEPMTASERKYIHNAIKDIEGVKTVSHGREPNRRIVVEPLDSTPRGGGGYARRDDGRPDRRGGERGHSGRDVGPDAEGAAERAAERRRLYTQFGERFAGDTTEQPLGKITGRLPILPVDPQTPVAPGENAPEETLDWRPSFFKSPEALPPVDPAVPFPEVVDDLHD